MSHIVSARGQTAKHLNATKLVILEFTFRAIAGELVLPMLANNGLEVRGDFLSGLLAGARRSRPQQSNEEHP